MSHPPPASSSRLFWSLQLGGWLAFGVAMALSRLGRYPLDYMVATKGTLAMLGVVVSLGLRAVYRASLRDDASPARIVVVTTVASYALSLPWTAAYNVVDWHIASALLERVSPVRWQPGWLFAGAVYHALALLAWSVLYVALTRHQALVAERERALRAEASAHRARLQALRYQLQPHFLFNTLNAISTLVVEGRTAEASRMLARLGDFLRGTLAAGDADEVPLSEEVEFASRYLAIEQVRFGDRLAVQVEVAPDADRALVPSLLLQPLVENAIRHAVALREEGGAIRIAATRQDGRLRLSVEDDGGGSGNGDGTGRGVGLANTRARLAELYGGASSLDVGPAAGGGHRVSIELPYREARS